MYLEIRTHSGLKPETKQAIFERMPRGLQAAVNEHFQLDLRHPSELQVVPPVECWTAAPGRFLDWTLHDVFNESGRNYLRVLGAINTLFEAILQKHELEPGEELGLRGSIPHSRSIRTVTEDIKPVMVKKEA